MVNHPNRSNSSHGFFLYKTLNGLNGLIQTREVARIEEIGPDAASLRIFMKDGSVVESLTYDLTGFATEVLGDDAIEELIAAAN